jgi:hypothetical protein
MRPKMPTMGCRFQFSLRSLLLATTGVAIALSVIKCVGFDLFYAILIAYAAVPTIAIAIGAYQRKCSPAARAAVIGCVALVLSIVFLGVCVGLCGLRIDEITVVLIVVICGPWTLQFVFATPFLDDIFAPATPLGDDSRIKEQKYLLELAGRRAGWDDPEMDAYDDVGPHEVGG